MATTREFFQRATIARDVVDRFLDPNGRNWAVFDRELGYLIQDSVDKDGVDGAYTVSNFRPHGHRKMINYAEMPCRINTYGDSFTQCNQVSNGESWQEYLAAHLGEPIRNFGVGGHGVFQAYRRMLREEDTELAADYVILNVWSNDHFRNIYPWHWLASGEEIRDRIRTDAYSPGVAMFHLNPWDHLRLDPDSGRIEEHENAYPTTESLYLLGDTDHIHEAFKDQFATQAIMAKQHISDVDTGVIGRVAEALDVATDFSSPEGTAATAAETLRMCALRSTMYVVDRAAEFAERQGKRLLVLLSFSAEDVVAECEGRPRFDREFVDYLRRQDITFVDTLRSHADEYKRFRGSPEEYVAGYYIFHYNPQGNHFFAFAVKDAVVRWLDPRPPAYRDDDRAALAVLASSAV